MTVAHGFGEQTDEGRRTTATSLPRVRDGPFVVFAPADHPAPGALGTLAAPVLLFSTVALGYAAETGDRRRTRWAFALVAGGAVASLAATAPITELGGSLFLLVPVLLTRLASGCVVIVTPLYRLGGALAAAESGE